jgi:hypothetical protein
MINIEIVIISMLSEKNQNVEFYFVCVYMSMCGLVIKPRGWPKKKKRKKESSLPPTGAGTYWASALPSSHIPRS